MSSKLVPTFADRGCRVVSATDPRGRILGFLDRSRYYFFLFTVKSVVVFFFATVFLGYTFKFRYFNSNLKTVSHNK
jgi:uncharacterized membrane protein